MKLTEYINPWIIWYADGEIIETQHNSRPLAESFHKICTVYPGINMKYLQHIFDSYDIENLADPIYVENIFCEKLALYHDELYPYSED